MEVPDTARPVPEGYVLIERERFERLVAAAMMGRDDDELYPSHLEPGDLADTPEDFHGYEIPR